MFRICCSVLVLVAIFSPAPAQTLRTDYQKDVRFALDALEKECGHFFKLKQIDWKKVRKQFLKEAKAVKSDPDHLVLLTRLLARLRDGHAYVKPLARGKGVKWPDSTEKVGPGMFWCRVGKKIYVKNAWSTAAAAGVKSGMQVVKVDGKPADRWLTARTAEVADLCSFSTPTQALFFTCTRGLAEAPGARMKLEVKDLKGKRKKKTISYSKASTVPQGPAFFPCAVKSIGRGDVNWGTLAGGHGYVHVRRCKGNLPEMMDEALAGLGNPPGLILDFRGNSGGGFDHDGFMGRFVPAGKTLSFAKTYAPAGPAQYGGPIVVIVDGSVVSAGETASGIFKEDGRAYMIGESATAGMSSQKKTIELPSQLFALYVSVRSNKRRFNQGRGIEGIGVPPHEMVAFDPKDLTAEKDTLIRRAEALLKKFPQKKVPYDPAAFGWKR